MVNIGTLVSLLPNAEGVTVQVRDKAGMVLEELQLSIEDFLSLASEVIPAPPVVEDPNESET